MLPDFETTRVWTGSTVLNYHSVMGSRSPGTDPALRDAFIAHGEARNNLDRLFSNDAWCVTSGQQPGLFFGPLFTVYKALSAVCLSKKIESVTGRAVVPVFWAAGDDHDFAEANHIHTLDLDNVVQRVGMSERDPGEPLEPLYRHRLGVEIEEVLDSVSSYAPETEFKPEVLDWLRRHYREERTMSAAFLHALAEALGHHGLVVFDPTAQVAKRKAAPWMLQALEQTRELDRALVERANGLETEGHEVPVAVGKDASLVMLEAEQGRDRLVSDGDDFLTRRSGERWSMDQLSEISSSAPERLSANVLLRPVIEAAMLPTIAYCAGPGELRYLPQTDPVYQALGVKPQGRVPRWSARVVEGKVHKVLSKYGIDAEELSAPPGQLERKLARKDLPEAADQAISTIRNCIGQEYERLLKAAVEIDPTLKRSVQSARNSQFATVKDVEKKLVSHLKQKNEVVSQQIAKARNALYPGGRPQERVLNVTYFLFRYGWEFLDGAASKCAEWADQLELTSGTA